MKTIIGMLLFLLVMGCAHIATLELTPEEKVYLSKIEKIPIQATPEKMTVKTEFTLSNSESEKAWSRAQSWVGRFSSMKLQTVTDYVIQTYNPRGTKRGFGYNITRNLLEKETQFTILCQADLFHLPDAETNVRVLAYYIQTGELSERLISQ